MVTRQLARSPYLAGDTFTAADISVTYALEFAQRTGVVALGESEQAYVARTSGREGYKRAMETCHGTRAWAAEGPVEPLLALDQIRSESSTRILPRLRRADSCSIEPRVYVEAAAKLDLFARLTLISAGP